MSRPLHVIRPVGVGTFESDSEMIAEVVKVLESNRISYGPKCKEFEYQVSSIHGNKYGVLSNSGTSSLHVALQAMKEIHGWEDGDEVIVPASTFVATINVVLQNNLTPVLVDIDEYFGMSYNRLADEDGFVRRCKAIIPVNPFGQPANIKTIYNLYKRRARIIADSCECMFATVDNQPLGSYADITCFSFYIAHLITTGVGGMAITDDERYAIKMRSLVNHGRDNIYISIDDTNPDRLREVIGKRFEFESIGHSFRITELEAAIGLVQLKYRDRMLVKRHRNASILRSELTELAEDRLTFLRDRPNTTNSWMMFPIVVNTSSFTKGDITEFLESRGIETRDALPVIFQPCYKGMWDPYDYPNAKNLYDNGFYIGCHQNLEDIDICYIIDTFKEFFNG